MERWGNERAGRVAVVTGTGSGIGAHLAEKLAQNGWDLALINRNRAKTAPLIQAMRERHPSREITVWEADLSDHAALRQAATGIAARHSRIDALFNNAGVLLGDLTFSKQDTEMHFEVNTLAPYQLMRLLHAPLAEAARQDGSARIVNVSSDALFMTGRLNIEGLPRPARLTKLIGAYAQSKLALTTLTIGLASQYARDGIVLRSVCPGANDTPMTAGTGMPAILLLLRRFIFGVPENGAERVFGAAFATELRADTGLFLVNGKVRKPPKDATDPAVQSRLLALCHRLTGL